MKYFVMLLVLATACGPLGRSESDRQDPRAIAPEPTSIDVAPFAEDCPAEARVVYVVDANDLFASFNPESLQFHDIGKLHCPVLYGATPFSMSVDRHAVAWVLYSSGEVVTVDTKTAKCTKTGYVPEVGMRLFGMGFSTNMSGGDEETLFIAGGDTVATPSSTLGTFSTAALRISKLQEITGSPELTGTGDARLWGFFPDETAPWIAEISKNDGVFKNVTPLPDLAGAPRAWAFAFWGGDFWIFLRRQEPSSVVYQYDPDTGQVLNVIPRSGRQIVGAGVSTCAPLLR